MERSYETMTESEKQTRFAAICKWVDTNLTHSVYVLFCKTPEEAERKSFDYFLQKKNKLIFKEIKTIEILPQGKGLFDNCEPVFKRIYSKNM